MKKHKLTHIGIVESSHLGTPSYQVKLLRRTKGFWITEKGAKYHLNGSEAIVGRTVRLVIDSIKPIENPHTNVCTETS